MTHAGLKAALAVFGFSEHDQLTLAQIKRRQRELARRNHPDLRGDELAMREINAAAGVLLAYLKEYRFTFTEEEFYRQNPDELLRRQFGSDPWGG